MEANIQNPMEQSAEFNRFGLISMIILVIGCLGGGAVGMGAINHTATLIAVIVPTMLTLSLLLAVAPMKWIIACAVATVFIDLLLMSYYLLV